QRGCPVQQIGDPFRLRLGQRHDRTERLYETDEVQAHMGWVDDAVEQRYLVVGSGDDLVVQERERDLVACAIDDSTDLPGRAIGDVVRWSVRMPNRYLGRTCAPRRIARNVRSETLDVSTAISQAELPMPSTSTRLPMYSSNVL